MISFVVVVVVVLALGVGWYCQIRGAKRFNDRYEKMSENERRAFEQTGTTTKLG